jgi:two-component system, OmpR family, alkaline phosphatase synthesis response regulator PhoP
MRILIIDDEEDVRRIATLSLVHVGGFEVIEAASGEEGLRLARAQKPDAILLDVMMPVMDGPATLEALQEDPETRDIPVLFVTARATPSEVESLESLGVKGILTKPFHAMSFPDQLRAVLRG